jgi:hypothetical protein
MKLGLQGVSVLVASGDSGVAGSQCLGSTGKFILSVKDKLEASITNFQQARSSRQIFPLHVLTSPQ